MLITSPQRCRIKHDAVALLSSLIADEPKHHRTINSRSSSKQHRVPRLFHFSIIKHPPHASDTASHSIKWANERRRGGKIIFPLCYRINSMKIQFRFPVVERWKNSPLPFARSSHFPPTFAFLIFYFVKVSCSCVYLKPVNSQQTLFPLSHPPPPERWYFFP
jgi:hypothetical protein